MYTRWSSLVSAGMVLLTILIGSARARAQTPSAQDGVSQEDRRHDMANMPGMQHDASHDANMSSREGSGTSWQPDETPMYALHATANGWTLMAHGSAFLQYLHESGNRGSDQTGSINWLMGMAGRNVGAGHVALRGMVSLEPWTIRGCGYPNLLATGEICDQGAIHDRQHPHDLFMELAAEYDRPLTNGVRWQLYGAPVGEPALGPVAFMHRVSALPNPLAPIAHHWFDATHIAYGVATTGLYGAKWKAEASVFNGREPDETRTNFDFAAMDSWSGRFWFLPVKQWAFQVSAGRLTEAESGHDGDARIDVDRITASATYHATVGQQGLSATTIGWGRNAERGSDATNAVLVETSFTWKDRDAWFGRFEMAAKTAHDLDVPGHRRFTLAKLQVGYTRYIATVKGLRPGIGATMSSGIVPVALKAVYGSRANAGVGVFLTLRPAAMTTRPPASAGEKAGLARQ